jgi:hypothetical protein
MAVPMRVGGGAKHKEDDQLPLGGRIHRGESRDLTNIIFLASSTLVKVSSAGIFKHSLWARNRVGIGLSYGLPGYTTLRNWFLGIDSSAPQKFKNSGSVEAAVGVKSHLGILSWVKWDCTKNGGTGPGIPSI